MGFWGRLRNALTRREWPTSRLLYVAPDQPSGIWITPENALDVSVVWACVMAITESLASSDWKVFGVDGETREEIPDHSLAYVLNVRPNPEMTAIAMREALDIQALTWGNSYAEIVRNARGDVAELWPLFSDRMTPWRNESGGLIYRYQTWDGTITELPPEKIYHLHGPGIAGLVGDNIVAHMAKTIGLASAQERFASTYFGNNTVIGGVLKHPKKLQPEAHEKLKKEWIDKYGGPFKANKPIILEEGMEWTPFSNDAEAAQLVQSRMFQIEEICRWYRVPPHKVAHLLRATFNNIEQLGMEFVRDAVKPWAKRHEQEADFKLLPQRAPWRKTCLDLSWLTQGDFKTRMEGYAIGRNIGVYTVNDILRKEGENTIGTDGDIRIVPSNMTRLEKVGETAAPNPSKGPGSQPGADAADANPTYNALARDAVIVLFASVFDRYAKRLKAREEDLVRGKKPAPMVQDHLAAYRASLRPWLIEECATAMDFLERLHASRPREDEIVSSALAVERGEDPKAAAVRLLPAPSGNVVVRGAEVPA